MLIFRGLTLVLLAGRTLAPYPETYQAISTGFLPDFLPLGGMKFSAVIIGALICPFLVWSQRQMIRFGAEVPSAASFMVKLVLSCVAIVFFCFWLGRYEGIPSVLILLAILFLIYYFFTTKTVMGRQLYALGGNEKAAKLSGINVFATTTKAYLISAFCAAIVGLILAGQAGMGNMEAGNSYEMYGVAAGVIGGISPLGGSGLLLGAFAGAGVWQTLENGLGIIGAPVGIQRIVIGVIVTGAVLIDVVFRQGTKKVKK